MGEKSCSDKGIATLTLMYTFIFICADDNCLPDIRGLRHTNYLE